MSPETMLGQLLTVLYSLVGLPISMLALKTIGEVIVSLVHSLVLRIEKRLFKTRHVHKIRMKTFLVTCVLMILFLLLGTVIQVTAEGWSFVEGIYTWFVILATIGFGDYIPFQTLDQRFHGANQKILWVVIVIMAFFTLAGLCVVSAVLTSLVQAAEEYRSNTKVTSKLFQFVSGKINKARRSKTYTVDYAGECEAVGQNYVDVPLGNISRVRSRSV